MKLVYVPGAGSEIVHRYCHLAIDGIHSAMLRTGSLLQHDYFKLTADHQLTNILRAEVGNEYASKRSSDCNCVRPITHSLYSGDVCWLVDDLQLSLF